jgi:predicted naringenin-chalcone synthase
MRIFWKGDAVLSNTPFYLVALDSKRPQYVSLQTHGLDWLAAAHTYAEFERRKALGNDLDFEPDAFHSYMRKALSRFGCGPEKIEKRAHITEDFLHFDWGKMEVYNLKNSPSGADLSRRSEVFQREVWKAFQEYYLPCNEGSSQAQVEAQWGPPGDVIHVSCTGYVSPSAAQRIVLEKGWQASTTVTHAYHMGCYASVPAVRTGVGFLGGSNYAPQVLQTKKYVDVVHSEACTLHLNPLLHSPEQLVVQSLFSDGFIRYRLTSDRSIAVELSEASGEAGVFQVCALREEIIPQSLSAMTWGLSPFGFSMTLSREVPQLIANALVPFLDRLFAQAELSFFELKDLCQFAVHPGGPKIVEKVEELLSLQPHQTQSSQAVLKEYGNMSSATLPHVWKHLAERSNVAMGTWVVSLAFGPGLTVCGALMRKEK